MRKLMESFDHRSVTALASVAVDGGIVGPIAGAGRRPHLTANALTVLERRYLLRDEQGRTVEKPAELFRRVAHAVAQADERHGGDPRSTEERFFERLAGLELLPNSPTLMNAGRDLGQLAACFVVPVGDSMQEIFDAVKWAAVIQMTGGGTGFAFSRLRPTGDIVSSTRGVASGPLPFMDVFNSATDAIKQGGTRRGANMGVLRVDHPDILEFVTAKIDPNRLRNFNVSVAVTDEFMAAVQAGASYALRNPRTGEEVKRLSARRVFDLMVGSAWSTGDPGVIFIDRINAAQPTPSAGAIESTNPCGEQPLLPFESCVLGSINVAKLVAGGAIDWPRLRAVVRDGVHFLDNVIDVNRYPLPQIDRATKANRKIGLGIMGFADLLIALGVPYDSERALEIAEELATVLEDESIAASMDLAARRGPFPNFAASRWAEAGSPPLRNATTTTVAPTGTISIIAGCSSGIEPLYAVSYERHVLDGERLLEVHPAFQRMAEERGIFTEALAAALAERGSVRGMDEVPEDLQALFATAHDLGPETHVRMQAAFQRHVHAAVSKTVNIAHDARPSVVADVYRMAYDLGCKGVTVYRDGSRAEQVLRFGETQDEVASLRPLETCPECGSRLLGKEGCIACRSCGWSRCV
jgi:ribonucleoside-diphosphate reductase alpha chain